MKTILPLLHHQSPEGDGAHDDWTKSVKGKYVVIAIHRNATSVRGRRWNQKPQRNV
jgi:hypothetical protein